MTPAATAGPPGGLNGFRAVSQVNVAAYSKEGSTADTKKSSTAPGPRLNGPGSDGRFNESVPCFQPRLADPSQRQLCSEVNMNDVIYISESLLNAKPSSHLRQKEMKARLQRTYKNPLILNPGTPLAAAGSSFKKQGSQKKAGSGLFSHAHLD